MGTQPQTPPAKPPAPTAQVQRVPKHSVSETPPVTAADVTP